MYNYIDELVQERRNSSALAMQEQTTNRHSYQFIRENAFKDVICKMAAILSRPQCIKSAWMIVARSTQAN